jgi:hypothetical protein
MNCIYRLLRVRRFYMYYLEIYTSSHKKKQSSEGSRMWCQNPIAVKNNHLYIVPILSDVPEGIDIKYSGIVDIHI